MIQPAVIPDQQAASQKQVRIYGETHGIEAAANAALGFMRVRPLPGAVVMEFEHDTPEGSALPKDWLETFRRQAVGLGWRVYFGDNIGGVDKAVKEKEEELAKKHSRAMVDGYELKKRQTGAPTKPFGMRIRDKKFAEVIHEALKEFDTVVVLVGAKHIKRIKRYLGAGVTVTGLDYSWRNFP